MNLKQLNGALSKSLEYTEESDAFETQSEREMDQDLNSQLDNEAKTKEKQDNKYVEIVKQILESNNLEYVFNSKFRAYQIYFNNKYDYDRFMAKEKNSKRLDSCLRQYYDKDKSFEQLPNDAGQRFLILFIKRG